MYLYFCTLLQLFQWVTKIRKLSTEKTSHSREDPHQESFCVLRRITRQTTAMPESRFTQVVAQFASTGISSDSTTYFIIVVQNSERYSHQ